MATAKKFKIPVPECNIRVSPTAAKLRTLEHRNCDIIEAVWEKCVSRIGEINPKIEVVVDLLDEMEMGYYFHATRELYINVLLTPQRVVRVLLHELTHANQYHTRRIRDAKVKGRWGVWFDGVFYQNTNGRKNDYWGAPWEVEARENETMAGKIIEGLNKWPVMSAKPWWLMEN